MPTIQLPHRAFEDIKSQRNFEALERFLEEANASAGAIEARASTLLAKVKSLETKVSALETKVSAFEKPEYVEVGAVRKPKEEFLISGTKPALVLWVNAAGKTTVVKVNKVNVLPETVAGPVGAGSCFPFKVPAGQKWEWEGEGEGHSTYLLE